MIPLKMTGLLILVLVLISGCATTHLTGSWKDPEYFSRIDHVYIVGISKNTATRRIFEDKFDQKFNSVGVTGLVSYKDFSTNPDTDKDIVMKRARERGAETILLTRMINKRTESVVTPGRVTSYATGPAYYSPNPYYREYSSYYARRYETIYEPPQVSKYQIATVESNLYDTASGELIWSAQFETTVEGNLQKMIEDFIAVVIKDMREKALL